MHRRCRRWASLAATSPTSLGGRTHRTPPSSAGTLALCRCRCLRRDLLRMDAQSLDPPMGEPQDEGSPRYLVMYIICSDAGQLLQEELSKSPQKILTNAFPQFVPQAEASAAQPSSMNNEGLTGPISDSFASQPSASAATSSDGYLHGLELISTLVKLMPDWLHNNRMVFDTLLLAWKSPARIARLQNEQELSLLQFGYLYCIMFLSSSSAVLQRTWHASINDSNL